MKRYAAEVHHRLGGLQHDEELIAAVDVLRGITLECIQQQRAVLASGIAGYVGFPDQVPLSWRADLHLGPLRCTPTVIDASEFGVRAGAVRGQNLLPGRRQ